MTNGRSTSSLCDAELEEALAILISSTRNKKRPFPLTYVAQSLEVAKVKLGSYSEVANRIDISPKMLRQFSYISRLSKPVQKMFELRQLDSVDALAHLAMLGSNDQHAVARALASGHIDTNDVRAIVELRKGDAGRPVSELIHTVKTTRNAKEYIVEFVVRSGRSDAALHKLLTKHIPESEIVRLEVNGVVGRLALTAKDKAALGRAAKTLGTPLRGVMAILQGASSV